MGLFKEIVLLPVAPLRTVVWTMQQALDAAERQHADNIRAELIALERALQEGELSEAEFDRREDELLDQLDSLQQGATER